jgi:hypothetical protein
MSREEKISSILGVIQKWGGFNVTEVQTESSIVVGELGGLIALIEYLSLDCIDVSVYSPSSFSSDSLVDYTMMYSELTNDVLDELLLLSIRYDDESSEEEHLSNSAVGY